MTPSNKEATDDYESLVSELNTHGVEYIIVGAYAVGYHGYLRGTGDLDILVKPSPENAVKVSAALKEFAAVEVAPAEITVKTRIVVGREPNKVDIMTSIKGISWDQAWNSRVPGQLGKQPASFLSRECLLSNKRAVGRDKDQLDIRALGGAQKPEQET